MESEFIFYQFSKINFPMNPILFDHFISELIQSSSSSSSGSGLENKWIVFFWKWILSKHASKKKKCV